jgi:hypothetical protein
VHYTDSELGWGGGKGGCTVIGLSGRHSACSSDFLFQISKQKTLRSLACSGCTGPAEGMQFLVVRGKGRRGRSGRHCAPWPLMWE